MIVSNLVVQPLRPHQAVDWREGRRGVDDPTPARIAVHGVVETRHDVVWFAHPFERRVAVR